MKRPHSRIKICKYCNKYFIHTHNRQVYCSPVCKKYARQDQKRDWKWKKQRDEDYKRKRQLELGSHGTIGEKPKPSFEEEAMVVHKELLRIKGVKLTKTQYAIELEKVKARL